jgi:hypothetical protein
MERRPVCCPYGTGRQGGRDQCFVPTGQGGRVCDRCYRCDVPTGQGGGEV